MRPALSLVLASLLVAVHGHGVITEVAGANGKTAVAFGVIADTPRDGSRARPFQQDSSIIRDREIARGTASACGRTRAGGVNDIETNLAAAVTAGLPTADADGQVSMTLHQVNGDGAGPYTCEVSADASGSDFVEMTVVTQVPGTRSRSRARAQDFPLVAQMPAGLACTGGPNGDACIVRCRNSARAGPFGGCVAVTTGDSGNATETTTTTTTTTDASTSTDAADTTTVSTSDSAAETTVSTTTVSDSAAETTAASTTSSDSAAETTAASTDAAADTTTVALSSDSAAETSVASTTVATSSEATESAAATETVSTSEAAATDASTAAASTTTSAEESTTATATTDSSAATATSSDTELTDDEIATAEAEEAEEDEDEAEEAATPTQKTSKGKGGLKTTLGGLIRGKLAQAGGNKKRMFRSRIAAREHVGRWIAA